MKSAKEYTEQFFYEDDSGKLLKGSLYFEDIEGLFKEAQLDAIEECAKVVTGTIPAFPNPGLTPLAEILFQVVDKVRKLKESIK